MNRLWYFCAVWICQSYMIIYELSNQWVKEHFFVSFFCSWTLIPCFINILELTRYVFNFLKTVTPYSPPDVPILDFVMLKMLSRLQWGRGHARKRGKNVSTDFRLRSHDTIGTGKGWGFHLRVCFKSSWEGSLILYMLCVCWELLCCASLPWFTCQSWESKKWWASKGNRGG